MSAKKHRTIDQRLAHLVNNELHADFQFIIEEANNCRIPAHKLIVGAAGSDELRNIVYGTSLLQPVADNSTVVTEIGADAFVEILRYLYTDKANLSADNVFDILKKSNYYGLVDLQRQCADLLIVSLRRDCCLSVYAQLYSLSPFPEIIRHCLRLIRYAPRSVAFEHDSWPDVSRAALREILASDAINCTETELFAALLSWAQQRCQRRGGGGSDQPVTVESLRDEIGTLHECIRWQTMSVPEFDRCVQLQPAIFSAAEVLAMRMRCDATAQRRHWLTSQNDVWFHNTGDMDLHPGAVYAGRNSREVIPRYVGRALKPGTNNNTTPGSSQMTAMSIKQCANDRDDAHDVLLGDGYEWVAYERGGDIPHGAVVLEGGDACVGDGQPTYVGRCSRDDGRLLAIDWHNETLVKANGQRLNGDFEVLIGRNRLTPHGPSDGIPADAMCLEQRTSDGRPLYLGRLFYENDVLPARIDHQTRRAYSAINYSECSTAEYVFVRGLEAAEVQWVPSRRGEILPLAVPGGRTQKDEILYVGRTQLRTTGGWLVGKVHPSHGCMYAAVDGEERRFDGYEMLVWTDAARATQQR